jgi:hypothetical protein
MEKENICRVIETDDWYISPRIQQSLLHWGYRINDNDFEEYKQLKLISYDDTSTIERMGL